MNLLTEIPAIERELEEAAARTEIIRIRVSPDQKADFAKCSAAKGLPSATHGYHLLMGAVHAHVRRRASHRTGAARGPVARGAMRPPRV